MAETDRERWNQRYRQRPYEFTPAAWLVALEPQLRPRLKGAGSAARALDLACGGGRNALFLARLGYAVDAWDISDVALEVLRAELARLARLGEPLAVRTRRVDLEQISLPRGRYDLLLDTHYLDRALFGAMAAALRPGGLLVLQAFLQPPAGASATRSHTPAHALEPGELGRAFPSLEAIACREDLARGEARLLARRPPGRRGPSGRAEGTP